MASLNDIDIIAFEKIVFNFDVPEDQKGIFVMGFHLAKVGLVDPPTDVDPDCLAIEIADVA